LEWNKFMIVNQDLKALLDQHGENLIIRNNKIFGICECKGKGKGRCRGNGWAKHVKDSQNEEPAFDFNKCKYIKPI
jgi:hypothetical protein